jgi:hypothetical protein
LTTLGDALVALAEVLGEAGKTAEAADAAEEAVGLYAQKGDRVSTARATELADRYRGRRIEPSTPPP